MERYVKIPFDLEGTPLQINTDLVVGSGDRIYVDLFDAFPAHIAGFQVLFNSPIEYWIDSCMYDHATLPTQPPDDVDQIWTFTKTSMSFIISCNGVEVLNYVFSDLDYCMSTWSPNNVEFIQFGYFSHTTLEYYRAKPPGKRP